MGFDGALGDIQVARDFGVVTSLEKQIDDLSFPGSHLIELFFHILCTLPIRPAAGSGAKPLPPRRIWIRVFASHFATTWPKWARQVN